MKEDEAEEIRAHLTLRLREQAERLVKLVDLKAPKPIMAREVGLIFKTALVLFPDCINELIGETLVRQARTSKWLCPQCGRHWMGPEKWCSGCEAVPDGIGGDDGKVSS